MNPSRILPASLLLASLLLVGAGSIIPPTDTAQEVRTDLQGILEGVGEDGSQWSVLALSLDQGDTLFAHEPHTALAPASNVKLISSALALRYLGPNFRFQTFLLGTGPVEEGVLRGDLILYGTGDPSMSSRFYENRDVAFRELAGALRQAGIESVAGDLLGDESYFEGPRRASGWDTLDLNDWFAAPVSALSYNENVFTLRVAPGGSAGEPPRIRTLPPEAGVPVSNLARTGGSGRLQILREDPARPIRIEGGIAAGGREVWREMTVQDPARFTTSAFRRVLEDEGITIRGQVRLLRNADGSPVTGRTVLAPGFRDEDRIRVLARHRSPPLVELLEVVNKRSHNLYAELLLLTVGRLARGDGSFEGGARVAEHFLQEEVGIPPDAIHLEDGSGLSGLNRVSAAAFVGLLEHMAESPFWEEFWESLPEAGNPRELRRMYQTAAAGNLRAKTGTIENASALSGVVRTGNGERIAFSIVANELPSRARAKSIENRIGSGLASFQRPFETRDEPVRLAGDGGTAGGATEGERSDEERVAAAGERGAEDAEGEEAGQRTHTVSSGENFTVIARRYGVTLNALVEANPGLSSRHLRPGQELAVPGAPDDEEATPDPARTTDVQRHRVRSGENFTVIARTYGVSLNELMDANPGVSPRSLRAGQEIRIPEPSGNERE